MPSENIKLTQWVEQVAQQTQPENVVWCDGSQEENDRLVSEMLADGTFHELNQDTFPGCYLHRSDPGDVARTENLTFVCTTNQDDAGKNNNWMSPQDGHKKVDALFAGCMKGRTMYVVPYCMGPIDSPFSRCGVEITDSRYVVANMRLMTRMGSEALKRINRGGTFVKGLHSTGDLKIENRLIMHFPEELTIKSIGSGYGGNALLGKKCHALRIASHQAREEGWLAEHMLILGLQNPEGETHYVAAAFPSQCGKTNLAMIIPPESYQGWKVWTVGDDIAWLHVGHDGRLYAINPEAGFFGVVPGTSEKTNPTALNMIKSNTIYTNVAVTENNEPWWEGCSGKPSLDWQGRPYEGGKPAAHPNSRFTVSMRQCASYSEMAEDAQGVPISAIIFGGRRPSLVPLVYEAKSWAHGVMVGAATASQTTAAATGKVGVLRHDPMAMKPFCGYDFGQYWQHWLTFQNRVSKLPKIFHVNWFRKDEDGKFMWPGFGENMRVLEWIINRARGAGSARRTPIGYVPTEEGLNLVGININEKKFRDLCEVTPKDWLGEMAETRSYFDSVGKSVPAELYAELDRIVEELEN